MNNYKIKSSRCQTLSGLRWIIPNANNFSKFSLINLEHRVLLFSIFGLLPQQPLQILDFAQNLRVLPVIYGAN